jgi:hypothetical protein
MKFFINSKTKSLFLALLFIAVSAVSVFSLSAGFTGRTLKTSTSGCGGCHGSSATSDVTVIITGPDSVAAGSTASFIVAVSKQSKTGSGVDIAVKNGTLTPVSPYLHLVSGELTQTANVPMVLGVAVYQFTYNAPAVPGTDSLFATGLATNSDAGTSGDDWNFAPSRRILVTNPIGVNNNSNPVEYRLDQNYPNPFNPSTTISFSIPKSMEVNISIYDAAGNKVENLFTGRMNEGNHELKWNASSVSSGVYFYKLTAEDFTSVKKMMLIK